MLIGAGWNNWKGLEAGTYRRDGDDLVRLEEPLVFVVVADSGSQERTEIQVDPDGVAFHRINDGCALVAFVDMPDPVYRDCEDCLRSGWRVRMSKKGNRILDRCDDCDGSGRVEVIDG